MPKTWLLFLAVFVIAKVGFSGSLIFYDSMMVDVTTDERMDKVSSHGYAWKFWMMATFVGVFQGAIRALSRSYYAKIIPKEKSSEYFGIFMFVIGFIFFQIQRSTEVYCHFTDVLQRE